MVHILHISDLHLVHDPQWNNMKSAILSSVGKRLEGVPRGQKLLIVTGDLHNFMQGDYCQAEDFLLQLFQVMDIEPDKDVFIVPGNHDVSNVDAERKIYGQAIRSDFKLLKENTGKLLSYYKEYIELVRKLGVYPRNCGNLPVCAHVRTWRDRLHILHLNTTLVADGVNKEGQMADIYTATSDDIRRQLSAGHLPCIAIGHNSFFDLLDNHQVVLSAMFFQENISAYLCGDRHKRFSSRKENKIELSGNFNSVWIPNIVSYRSSTDENDAYSDFGMIWQQWDEESGQVALEFMKWNPEDQAYLQPDGAKDGFCFRRDMQKKMHDAQTSKGEVFKDANANHLNPPSQASGHHKFMFWGILMSLGLFLAGVLLWAVATWHVDTGQKAKKKEPIENDYRLVKNENELWELDLSNMELSNINFLEKYELSKIQELDLSNNDLLVDIHFLKGMKNLRKLNLSNTRVADASVIKGLTKLDELDLSHTQIHDIAFVEKLRKLKTFRIKSCEKLKDISLVSQLPSLQTLNISDCKNDDVWRSMPILPRLQHLYMGGYELKGEFDFHLYSSLTILDIENTDVEDLSVLSSLQNLHTLYVQDSVTDFAGIEKLAGLKSLSMGLYLSPRAEKEMPQHVEAIRNLNLTSLTVFSKRPEIFKEIAELTTLEDLFIFSTGYPVTNFSFLSNKGNLKNLTLYCPVKGNPSEIGKLGKLESLTICDTDFADDVPAYTADLSFLNTCTELKKLDLKLDQVNDISFLSGLAHIEELAIDVGRLKDFTAIGELARLKKLELKQAFDVTDFSFLENLQEMEKLSIEDAGFASFYGISGLTRLKELSITNTNIPNVEFLNNLVHLERLTLSGNRESKKERFDDISFVRRMKRLKTLNLSYCKIKDMAPILDLRQLSALDLSYATLDSDVSELSKMDRLNSLNLEGLEINNLKPLASLHYLGRLNLGNCFFDEGAQWDFVGFENLKEVDVHSSTIPTLEWLGKCHALCSVNIADTVIDGLYRQLKSVVKGKEECTVTYDVSQLTPGQLADFNKLNPSCEWKIDD